MEILNKMKIIKKVWGEERVIHNGKYCGKILILKRGFRCSLHHHKKKEETFYLNRGKILMEVGDKKWVMKYGDIQHIEPGCKHRFTGITDAEIFEFSSHHDDSDSYRTELSGKAHLRKAYDYDGVVTKGIKSKENSPIITSRSFEEIDRIDLKILKKYPVYFNPVTWSEKNKENGILWKVKMIKKLEIEEFFEDDCETIKILEKRCPDCNITKI